MTVTTMLFSYLDWWCRFWCWWFPTLDDVVGHRQLGTSGCIRGCGGM